MSGSGRYLVMRAGRHHYALPLEQVAEVSELRSLSPVPRVPAWCVGAARSAGLVVAVVDLALFLTGETSADAEKLVVIDHRIAGLALQVAEVTTVIVGETVSLVLDGDAFWLDTPECRASLLDAETLTAELGVALGR